MRGLSFLLLLSLTSCSRQLVNERRQPKPVLVERSAIEAQNLRERLITRTPLTPHRPVGEQLTLLLPGAIRAHFDEHLDRAIKALVERPAPTLKDEGDGVYSLEANDDSAVAQFVLSRGWERFGPGGAAVLLLAGPRRLFVAAEANTLGLSHMFAIAHAGAPGGSWTWRALRASGGTLAPFRPSPGPVFADYEDLYWSAVIEDQRVVAAALTAHQSSRDRRAEEARPDVPEDAIVVELGLEKTGALTSTSTFILTGEGSQPVLLPRAERVMLLDANDPRLRSLGSAPWGHFVKVMGSVVEPTSLWPETVLVKRPPTIEELDRLLAP